MAKAPPDSPQQTNPPSHRERHGVRFAPSPTGRFHIGNLRTAWISHRLAHKLNTPWVVRFEDIDRPRVRAGAQRLQVEDMATLGLRADQTIIQSAAHMTHHRLFIEAVASGVVYPCDCSRKDVLADLAGAASAPHGGIPVYSGRCRDRQVEALPLSDHSKSWAWRFRMPNVHGKDDFIVARTPPQHEAEHSPDTFIPSYHWACAIDDHFGNYAYLVRAWDLADSAPLQRAIQTWLCQKEGRVTEFPTLFHTSLVVDDQGGRLEKRTAGVTLPELLARGLTPNGIVHAFEQSFDDSSPALCATSNGIEGESRREIPLSLLLP